MAKWGILKPKEKNTRTYGGENTIHQTDQLDVITHNGEVVAVWFRCQLIKFQQVEYPNVDGLRGAKGMPIDSVEIKEDPTP